MSNFRDKVDINAKDNDGNTALKIAEDCKANNAVQLLINSGATRSWLFCDRYEFKSGPPKHKSATAIVIKAEDYDVTDVYRTAAGGADARLDLDAFQKAIVALGKQGLHHPAEISKESTDLSDHFKDCDKDGDGRVTVDEFVDYCVTNLKRSRPVVVKLMKNEGQWLRETELRKAHNFDDKCVVNILLPAPDPAAFAAATKEFKLKMSKDNELLLSDYPHGIVMPFAERTLDFIHRAERPDLAHVRMLMNQVGEALQHLHSKGIIHGDVKMLNIVRVDGRMRLIDLDAACKFGSFAGSKFSSGVLPPEMFARLTLLEAQELDTYWKKHLLPPEMFARLTQLEAQELNTYWEKHLRAEDRELFDKVKPRPCGDNFDVVRTFATTDAASGGAPLTAGLPYEPRVASPAIDAWAFGALLFYLVAAAPLQLVDRDEDLADGAGFEAVQGWKYNAAGLTSLIDAKVLPKSEAAADLLTHLLHPDPGKRWTVKDALDHRFFKPPPTPVQSSDNNVIEIKGMLIEIKGDVKDIKKDVKTALVKLDHIAAQIENVAEFQRLGFEALREQALRYHAEDKAYFQAHGAMLDAQFALLKDMDKNVQGLSEQVAKGFLKAESALDRVGAEITNTLLTNGAESSKKLLDQLEALHTALEGANLQDVATLVSSSLADMSRDLKEELIQSVQDVMAEPRGEGAALSQQEKLEHLKEMVSATLSQVKDVQKGLDDVKELSTAPHTVAGTREAVSTPEKKKFIMPRTFILLPYEPYEQEEAATASGVHAAAATDTTAGAPTQSTWGLLELSKSKAGLAMQEMKRVLKKGYETAKGVAATVR